MSVHSGGYTGTVRTIAEARRIAGSLGFPSKMPGTSYGLPATACIAGMKLAKVPGTICSQCYALSNSAAYLMRNAVIGQQRRLAGIRHPRWIEAMVRLLNHSHAKPMIRVDLGLVGVRAQKKGGSRVRWNETGYHRWHDSGDLQSIEHLAAICEVAKRTPRIRHWLPTQELGIVWAHLDRGGVIPRNLLIRVSSVKIDEVAPRTWRLMSSVFTASPPAGAHVCPAPQQDHQCGKCRACWRFDVPLVAYAKH